MSVFRQIGAVVGMNMRSVPRRLGTSSVVVIGIAGVVGVVVSIFGMNRSLGSWLSSTRAGRIARSCCATARTAKAPARCSSTRSPRSRTRPESRARRGRRGRLGRYDHDGELASAGRTASHGGSADPRRTSRSPSSCGPRSRSSLGECSSPGLRELIVGPRRAEGVPGLDIGDQRCPLRNSQWDRGRRVRERRRRERVARTRRRGDAHVGVRPHGGEQRHGAA